MTDTITPETIMEMHRAGIPVTMAMVAEALGISLNAANIRLMRALVKMRNKMHRSEFTI